MDDIEKKTLMILKILNEEGHHLGSRQLSRRLSEGGINMSERTVRYHLRLLDEKGFTSLVDRHEGRIITGKGREELSHARVKDKVGLSISRIETLAFHTSFDPGRREGFLPMNLSLFPAKYFSKALTLMKPAFKAGLAVSHLVAVAQEGERIGDFPVPPGQVALATVCSITINGVLLKRGIPMDSKFGGILELRQGGPHRFVELIHYSASSLDPSEVFILSKMTSVRQAAQSGQGKILANFREILAETRPLVESLVAELKEAGIGGAIALGHPGEPLGEIPVDIRKAGVILLGGLNPVAATHEAGIPVENKAMSIIMDYGKLKSFWDL
jgi:repressor of nif and glnA expression